MPLTLVPPREGRSKFYRVRGTYLGVRVDRTTETADKAVARRLLAGWKAQIERGELSGRRELTFAAAILSYIKAGGERRFLVPIKEHFGPTALVRDLTQAILDEAAHAIYPTASPATRNRQFYTPVSAILKHAGVGDAIRRPKGAQGQLRTGWLWPEDAARLVRAASTQNPEFGAFLTVLLYTGMRLGDALSLDCRMVRLPESFAFVGKTKNGEPRPVFLPPAAVAALANHPRGLNRDGKVFRFRKNGALYATMASAKAAAGPDLGWVTFHVLCHTWATWMRRYAGLDTKGLVATGRWTDTKSASRYEHVVVSEEAERARMLPDINIRAPSGRK